ncbi:hypothetical protein [Alteromonas macleodii]|uniref:hypothetical protein n=1 Tax=Alteromonas macleodii TaxID=28108 RepID=UPI001928F7E3|nr:hypothetical protein [Alteromonas macleodii]MBL3809563.1 hypothetical protein [Alteromonas macleodii]MBL3883100.1 hypothetical protein [Alteromonas macleodii]
MTTSMINKALDLEDKVSANMKKASAILQAMRTLHSEDCRMNEEITGNLLWAASDLIDDAIQADADFLNEQTEKDLWIRYQQVPGNPQIKAVK